MPGQAPVPVCLVVMDGWGLAPPGPGNAITLAETPNFDRLCEIYPTTSLKVSGEAVGLPPGQMGNSEVGHLNLGAGRIVLQDLSRINKAIDDGSFFNNPILAEAFDRARDSEHAVHLIGLLSDGGVHSGIGHIKALIEMAKQRGCKRVFLHAFMDGRDTPPTSGKGYIEDITGFMTEAGIGAIATVCGRYYAMDRDNRWDRVKLAYDAMIGGNGQLNIDPVKVLDDSYEAGVTDEFVVPTITSSDPLSRVADTDSVIFFNFRPDRAREMSRALIERDFDQFDRGPRPPAPFFVSMTEYDAKFAAPVAFPPEELKNVLAVVLSRAGRRQLHIAETEKYAHVTFFFNGGVEKINPGEERVLIPSPTDVATYDKKPEMSAFEVTAELERQLRESDFDFVIANLANCDMVGHTGVLEAAIKAVETVDDCVGRIAAAVAEKGGVCMITADHGNAEIMLSEGGGPETAHTSERVPFILTMDAKLAEDSTLADIAPTVLGLLRLPVPPEMTGHSMIIAD